MEKEKTSLSNKLLGKYPQKAVKKYLAYIDNTKREELKKADEKRIVSRNTDEDFYSLFVKYYNMGIVIDGINAVVTGKSMAMVTYHGYKNAVIKAYPEAEFDVQLVKKKDKFSVAKESGDVIYSHDLTDPFNQEHNPIIGAYAIIKTKRGECFEALNKADFDEMKKSSKVSYLWETWESEFWLKSVIKRACKRHLYDVVAEIDNSDNEDYGLENNVKATPEKNRK